MTHYMLSKKVDELYKTLLHATECANEISYELAQMKIVNDTTDICTWCLDTADVEIQVEKGSNFCARCGRRLEILRRH